MTLSDALVRINAAHVWSLAFVAPLAGGEIGASEVVDRSGRRLVAKWEYPAAEDVCERLLQAVELVGGLRDRGAKMSAYLLVDSIERGVLVLQELMSGKASDELPDLLIEDLVGHNELQRGVAPVGGGWKQYVVRSLVVGLDGYCEHDSLRAHSAATRSLLERVRRIGEALTAVELEERDAVHLDFHHRNVLARNGRLSAVIDCEGMRTGDRIFDLVTLAFCLHVAQRSQTAERQLWQTIRSQRSPTTVCAYIAHQALRKVDWSIRHRTSQDITSWLQRATELLPAKG